jgi:hypothetical protein
MEDSPAPKQRTAFAKLQLGFLSRELEDPAVMGNNDDDGPFKCVKVENHRCNHEPSRRHAPKTPPPQ